MKEITLSELGIKILLKCLGEPISKHDVTQFFKPYQKTERDNTLEYLINNKYLDSRKIPKPNTKKTPTYYFITNKGEEWVKEYLLVFKKKGKL